MATNPPLWQSILTLSIYAGQAFSIICSVIFLSAILCKDTVRRVSYNIYLVMIVIPDMILNLSFFITFQFRENDDGTFNRDWSRVVIWSVSFYYTCNFWSNLLIAYQIFTLVKKSYRRIKMKAPSLNTVYIQGACVYVPSFLISVWFALEVPWSPYSTSPNGKTVWRSPNGGVFTPKATFILVGFILLTPTIYVVYAAISMWWNKFLPRTGRTRVISIYFFRILFVFFAFYYPGMVLNFLKSSIPSSSNLWFILWFFNRLLEILQALVTIYLARQKDDIKKVTNEALSKIFKVLRSPCNQSPKSSPDVIAGHDGNINQVHLSLSKGGDKRSSFVNSDNTSAATINGMEPEAKTKWEEEDIYVYPKSRGSMVGSMVQREAWGPVENEKVATTLGNKNPSDEGRSANGISELPRKDTQDRSASLYTKLGFKEGMSWDSPEAETERSEKRRSFFSTNNSSKKSTGKIAFYKNGSEEMNLSEVSMDSDFSRLRL
mmetsp:Transcript_26768/g.40488  ORF Transcript_26768/g.40488 Transcript_26768/m.40488 type:complete len:490 (+) Transcript_26768:245-1714(+)